IVRATDHPTYFNFLSAGFLSGLAVAVKQTAAIIGIPFVIALALNRSAAFRSAPGSAAFQAAPEGSSAGWQPSLLLWILGAMLGFFLLSPGTIFDFAHFYHYQVIQSHSLSGETDTFNFFVRQDSKFGTLVLRGLQSAVGIPLLIAAAAGMIVIWRKSAKA